MANQYLPEEELFNLLKERVDSENNYYVLSKRKQPRPDKFLTVIRLLYNCTDIEVNRLDGLFPLSKGFDGEKIVELTQASKTSKGKYSWFCDVQLQTEDITKKTVRNKICLSPMWREAYKRVLDSQNLLDMPYLEGDDDNEYDNFVETLVEPVETNYTEVNMSTSYYKLWSCVIAYMFLVELLLLTQSYWLPFVAENIDIVRLFIASKLSKLSQSDINWFWEWDILSDANKVYLADSLAIFLAKSKEVYLIFQKAFNCVFDYILKEMHENLPEILNYVEVVAVLFQRIFNEYLDKIVWSLRQWLIA